MQKDGRSLNSPPEQEKARTIPSEVFAMRFATRIMMLVAVSLFTLTPFAVGQAVYGSIYGTVTDATGAAVPGANITVTDVAKGTSVNVQSNGSGEFRVEHLIADVYDVKVDVSGFH